MQSAMSLSLESLHELLAAVSLGSDSFDGHRTPEGSATKREVKGSTYESWTKTLTENTASKVSTI